MINAAFHFDTPCPTYVIQRKTEMTKTNATKSEPKIDYSSLSAKTNACGEVTRTTTDKLMDRFEPIKEVILDEGADAIWRSVADQYKETVKVPFLAALYRNLNIGGNGTMDKVIRAKVAKFLETDLGDSLFMYVLSFSTQFITYQKTMAQRLARELRVAAQAKIFSKVMTAFFGPMRAALDEVIRGNAVLTNSMN